MRILGSFYVDDPAYPVLTAVVSYMGITTAAGLATGMTVVDDGLAAEPSYQALAVKMLDGPSAGQVRAIATHVGNTLGVSDPFTNPAGAPQQIAAGWRFVIISLAGGGEIPVWGTPTPGTHTTTGVTEETIVETAYTDPFLFYMLIDLVNMVALDHFTVRVYQRVDGANFRLKDEQDLQGAQTIDVYEVDGIYGDTACDIRVTIQRVSATDRSFPYRHNVLKEP